MSAAAARHYGDGGQDRNELHQRHQQARKHEELLRAREEADEREYLQQAQQEEQQEQQEPDVRRMAEFSPAEWGHWLDFVVPEPSASGLDRNTRLHDDLSRRGLTDESVRAFVEGVVLASGARAELAKERCKRLWLDSNKITSEGIVELARGLALAGVKLQSLNIKGNVKVDSLHGLIEAGDIVLSDLEELNVVGCSIRHFPRELCWMMPKLSTLEVGAQAHKETFTFPPDIVQLPPDCKVSFAGLRKQLVQVAQFSEGSEDSAKLVKIDERKSCMWGGQPVSFYVKSAGLSPDDVSRPSGALVKGARKQG